MASAPSSFYVNRDNYLAALDASQRAEEQSGEITGALGKYAGRALTRGGDTAWR
jgi:hypothetical protein